jgi:hypothetical protein
MGKGGSVSVKEGKAMPEDAPVNTGAARWPHPDTAYFAVQRMQSKLHRWAGGDPSRRFGDLFNLVYDPAFLVHAFERVASNAGAKTAGVDGMTVAQVKTREGGELEFLARLRDSLTARRVREGACGKRTMATAKPRPRAYLTLTRVDLPCLVRNPANYPGHRPFQNPRNEIRKTSSDSLDNIRASFCYRLLAWSGRLSSLFVGPDLRDGCAWHQSQPGTSSLKRKRSTRLIAP